MVSFSVVNLVMSRNFDLQLDEKRSFGDLTHEVVKRGFNATPALFMPIIILGGIYGGIMTPTEAAAIAVIYAIPVGFFIYKGLCLGQFPFRRTRSRYGRRRDHVDDPVFHDAQSDVRFREHPATDRQFHHLAVTESKVVLLILINVLLFLVGMVVNDVTAIILVAPLLLPLMQAIGVSPIQFAAHHGGQHGDGRRHAALRFDPLSRGPYRQGQGHQGDPAGNDAPVVRLSSGRRPDVCLARLVALPAQAVWLLTTCRKARSIIRSRNRAGSSNRY